MKNIIYTFLIVSLFVSCKSNTKQVGSDSTNKIKAIANQTQVLIKKFKPIIQGVWIKRDYLEKIIQTKSVAAADDKKNGVTEMYINTDSIHSDSIVLLAGYFNHDSGDVIIRFRPGKEPSSIEFNNGSLSYSILHGDTTITISEYDEHKKQIVKTTFTRVLKQQSEDNLEHGMTYAINRCIISGNYIMADTTAKISRVVFTNDGKVSGFLNFNKYQVAFDLNEGPMENLDEIYFDARTKNHKSFSFKINNDTLGLYTEYPNADSTELILGKRVYKLVKQK